MKIALKIIIISIFNIIIIFFSLKNKMVMPKLWQYSDAGIVTLHTGVPQMNQKKKEKTFNLHRPCKKST